MYFCGTFSILFLFKNSSAYFRYFILLSFFRIFFVNLYWLEVLSLWIEWVFVLLQKDSTTLTTTSITGPTMSPSSLGSPTRKTETHNLGRDGPQVVSTKVKTIETTTVILIDGRLFSHSIIWFTDCLIDWLIFADCSIALLFNCRDSRPH